MFWKSYFSYFNLLVKLRCDNKKSSATKDELYIYIYKQTENSSLRNKKIVI